VKAVNLLPRDEPKRARRKVTLGFQLALVSPFVIGGILAAGYLVTNSKVNDSKATLQALQHELASIPPKTEQPQTNAQLALQRDQRIEALGTALSGRVAWDRILREISSVLPEDVWLTSLAATSPANQAAAAAAAAAAPPPPPPTDTTETDTTQTDTTGTDTTAAPAPTTTTPAAPPTAPLSIAGYTYSQEGVARFMSRLAVIPELQDVKLVTSSQATVVGRNVVSFSITAGVLSPAAT